MPIMSDMLTQLYDLGHAWVSASTSDDDYDFSEERVLMDPNLSHEQAGHALLESAGFLLDDVKWTHRFEELLAQKVAALQTKAKKKKGRKRRRRRKVREVSDKQRYAPVSSLSSYRPPFESCLFLLNSPMMFKGPGVDFLSQNQQTNEVLFPPVLLENQHKFDQMGHFGFITRTQRPSIVIWGCVLSSKYRDDTEDSGWRLCFYLCDQIEEEIKASLDVIQDNGTYALSAKPPGTSEPVESWVSEKPEEYYKVHLRSGFVSDVCRGREEPLDLDRAYRWRVRGHWRMYVRRGPKPLEDWKALEFERKGFKVWTDSIEDEIERVRDLLDKERQ